MVKKTDLQMQEIDIDSLIPLEYNPNEIKGKNKTRLHTSIEKYGYLQPIVINKRNMKIVGGNQRFKFLKERGFTHTQVVTVDLDEDKERALAYLLNVTGENDPIKLAQMIIDIESQEIIKSQLGFVDEEIANFRLMLEQTENAQEQEKIMAYLEPYELLEQLLNTSLKDLDFRALLRMMNEYKDLMKKISEVKKPKE